MYDFCFITFTFVALHHCKRFVRRLYLCWSDKGGIHPYCLIWIPGIARWRHAPSWARRGRWPGAAWWGGCALVTYIITKITVRVTSAMGIAVSLSLTCDTEMSPPFVTLASSWKSWVPALTASQGTVAAAENGGPVTLSETCDTETPLPATTPAPQAKPVLGSCFLTFSHTVWLTCDAVAVSPTSGGATVVDMCRHSTVVDTCHYSTIILTLLRCSGTVTDQWHSDTVTDMWRCGTVWDLWHYSTATFKNTKIYAIWLLKFIWNIFIEISTTDIFPIKLTRTNQHQTRLTFWM